MTTANNAFHLTAGLAFARPQVNASVGPQRTGAALNAIPQGGSAMSEELKQIRDRLEKAIDSRPTSLDAWVFNGGTVAVLLLSGMASVLSANQGWHLVWLCGNFLGAVRIFCRPGTCLGMWAEVAFSYGDAGQPIELFKT